MKTQALRGKVLKTVSRMAQIPGTDKVLEKAMFFQLGFSDFLKRHQIDEDVIPYIYQKKQNKAQK